MNATPVLRREAVHYNRATQHLVTEASDHQLNGFPLEVAIPTREGELQTFRLAEFTKSREGEVTDALYRGGTLTLRILND